MNKRDITPALVNLHSIERASKTNSIRKKTIGRKGWFFGRGWESGRACLGFQQGSKAVRFMVLNDDSTLGLCIHSGGYCTGPGER